MSVLPSPTREPGDHPVAAGPAPSIRVLVIDAEKAVRRRLSTLLKRAGFKATAVASHKRALTLLHGQHFDLAISGVGMPSTECQATVAALKAADPGIEVILLGERATAKTVLGALRGGAGDFLVKPVQKEELVPALRRVLAGRRGKDKSDAATSSDAGLYRQLLTKSEEVEAARGEASQAEARARAVIESAREVIVLFDRDGVIVDFNPVAEEIFGLTRERAIGRKLTDFAVPPDLAEVFKVHTEAAYRQGRDPLHGSIEVTALRQNGEAFPFEITTVAIETPQGKLLSTFGRDVTEQRSVMKALRDSEGKLQAIYDGVKTGILVIDPKTHRIVDANPLALELVGADRERVVGAVCHKFICPAEVGRCPASDLGQVVDESERTLLTATGEKRSIIKTVRPVVIGGRKLLLESFVDITERKRAEQASVEAEERFHFLFSANPLPTFLIDVETLQNLEVNDAAVTYSGYSREELLRMKHADLLLPEDAPQIVANMQAQASNTQAHAAGRHRLRDGRVVDVEADIQWLEFRGRKAILAVIHDVTAQHRAQAEMAERHRLASLVADIGVVLTRTEGLRHGLQQCAEILVHSIDAAFARVWTMDSSEEVLELQASAGIYTHIDGGHARVPLGKFKIGQIAATGQPHLTNSVQEDPRVGDPAWARREGMVAFAGYPLKVGDHVVGVVAGFARHPLTDTTLQALAVVADSMAQFIERKRAELALRESEDRYRDLVENSFTLIGTHDAHGRILSLNQAAARLLGVTSAEKLQGRSLAEFLPPEFARTFPAYLETVLREGRAEGLMTLNAPNKGRRIIEFRNTLRRQDSGGPVVRWTGQDVTERVHAEKTKAFLASLVESSRDAIIGATVPGVIVSWNRGAEELYGYRAEEVIGKSMSILAPPDRASEIARSVESLERGEQVEYETVRLRKDGRLVDVSLTVSPVRDVRHRITGSVTVVRDITERKHAQQALWESQEQLRALLSNSTAMVYLKDAAGRYLRVNPAFEQVSGCKPGGVIGKTDHELFPKNVADKFQANDQQVLQQKTSLECEEFHYQNGVERAYLSVKFPLFDEEGEPYAVAAISTDITERKESERALRQSESRYRLLFERNLAGVFRHTLEGDILECNDSMARMFGYKSPQELIGSNIRRFWVDPGERDKMLALLAEYHSLGSYEICIRRKDGHRKWLLVSIHQTQPSAGEAPTLEGTAVDITHRKETERQMKLQATALQSAANGILITDPAGQIQWVNPAFTLLTGYEADEVVGKRPGILKSGVQDAAFYQNLWQTVRKGEVWKGELVNRRKDGTQYTEEMVITPVRDEAGVISHLIAIKQDITGRKRSERALRERTVYLNTLFESSPLGIAVVDIEGCIQMSNSAFEKLFLYSREEIWGKKLDDIIVPRGLTAEAQDLTSQCLKGPGAAISSARQRKDGSLIDVEIYGAPLVIEGELRGLLALYQDITARKQAEADLVKYAQDLEVSKSAQEEHAHELARLVEDLARERDLLGTLMDNLPDGIYYKDRQSRFLRANSVISKTLGLDDPRDAVGKTDSDFFPEEDAKAYFRNEQQVIETGQPLIGQIERVRQPDGLYRWHATSTVPVRDARGEVTGLVGITRDITERFQSEELLKASEKRYRELFENASDIVYTTGLDTRLTSLNRVGQQILGYTAEEATRIDLLEVVGPKHREMIKREYERLLAGASDITFEMEITAKDGRQVTLEVKPRVIYNGETPSGVQGIARDITGREAAEMELRHAQKLESVGRLAAGIAHEINTPIQFVGDNTRFLQDSFGDLGALLTKYQELRDAATAGNVGSELLTALRQQEEKSDCAYLLEEIPRALAQTLDGVSRVATIVLAMKEFAHPESKEMAGADLNKALQSTLTVARNELKYVAEVETQFGDLPAVVCNIGDVNQVFLNLLVNGAHAIADVVGNSGKLGKIQVRTWQEGNAVVVSISDTGGGIPEAIRGRIFDPFFTTKEVGRGTGQGLAIARSVVVDRHKGMLTFETETGKGTTFYVRLPLDPAEHQKETKAS